MKTYHNPENVPLDKVPAGWRLLYTEEAGKEQNKPCRIWMPISDQFDTSTNWLGASLFSTYIVPQESEPAVTPRARITRRRFKLSTR